MITVSVLYPKTATSRFNHDYYLGKHIPMVNSFWSVMGLSKVELFRGSATLDGGSPAYELIGLLHFSSQEAMAAALAAHGADVIGDIPNFTDVHPVIQVNTSAGRPAPERNGAE